MPSWMPPTPPISDSENDVYYDECLDLLYDPDFMGEARLPSTIYELHRPFTKPPSPVKRSHNTSNLSTEQTVMQLLKSASDQRTPSNYMSSPMPYSEDNDFAGADFCNIKTDDAFAGISVPKREKSRGRQDTRSQRDLERAVTPPRPIREEYDYEGPEWNIIEDRALLQAVRNENTLKHMLEKNRSPLTYNWEFISGFVNRVTGFYRSPRQCCIRYQTAVRPRENGQLVAIDPLTKKPRKVNLTTAEVVHLRKGRATTDLQYDFDVTSILENRILGKIKTIRALTAKSAKPFRRSLENVSIDALNGRLPLNHESKLNEFNLHRIQAEDIVQIHEEKHFSSELRKKAQEKPVAEERGNTQNRSMIVSVRPPAVTAGAGTVVSKAPFVLEVLALQPIRPTPPPPQSNSTTLQQEHNVVTYSQPGIQRRVGAMGNNFSHNMQPQSNQQSGYLVVGHENNVSGIRRQEAGGQGVNQVFRNFTGPPSRRTPPGTPITTGITRAPVGYVTSGGGQSGGGFSTSNQSSSNVYTSCPQPMATGIQRQVQGRVVSRGAGTRMYMTQNGTTIPERGYVVQSNVRMIPNSQRLPQRRTTVTNNPNGQMTTAMVMPNRQNIQQVRAVQRNAAIPPGSRIMVMAPNSRSGSQLVQGHSGAPMTRQLLTRGMNVPSRGGSPQTVAQVVIAPPSSMAQAPQHSSQPPQLTPSVVVTSSEAIPSPVSQNSQSQPGSQSAPSQQPPSQLQVQQVPAQHGHSSQQQTLQAPNANSSIETGPPSSSGSGPSSHS
ncbi:unnamed protein product [Auanema sp. JU1783]|nr:unnamed protein product [Auanema sp. JU1783]